MIPRFIRFGIFGFTAGKNNKPEGWWIITHDSWEMLYTRWLWRVYVRTDKTKYPSELRRAVCQNSKTNSLMKKLLTTLRSTS